MSAHTMRGRSVDFSSDLGADLVRLVRAGLGRFEAAGVVGMGARTLLTWQALGRRGHPDFQPWVEAIDQAARIGRRGRNQGGPKALEALARRCLKIALRWRWVTRPRVQALIAWPTGWFARKGPGRAPGMEPAAGLRSLRPV
jgi:hypothetical protein